LQRRFRRRRPTVIIRPWALVFASPQWCWASGWEACRSSSSSGVASDDVVHPVTPGDPAYALAVLRDHPVGDDGLLPRTLAAALPNHRIEESRSGTISAFSDALAVGRVTGAVEGAGAIWRGEDDFTVVGFDDERADTRTVVLTMTTQQVTGTPLPPDGQLSFRVLVPSEAEPERFAESLAGLGRIAVVLGPRPEPDRSANAVAADHRRPLDRGGGRRREARTADHAACHGVRRRHPHGVRPAGIRARPPDHVDVHGSLTDRRNAGQGATRRPEAP
jgi:hypothetical protein